MSFRKGEGAGDLERDLEDRILLAELRPALDAASDRSENDPYVRIGVCRSDMVERGALVGVQTATVISAGVIDNCRPVTIRSMDSYAVSASTAFVSS